MIQAISFYPAGRTQFYPGYNSDRDQVDAIKPVQRVQLQRVLPRYELNTGDTRSAGLGPHFDSGLIEKKVRLKNKATISQPTPAHAIKHIDTYA